MAVKIDLVGGYFNLVSVVDKSTDPLGFDSSIESIQSQEFSVGIFYFLVAAIIVFTVFVFMFMFKDRASKLKKGEKIMFAWLLLGIVVAVGFGAAQLLHGYLF
ncbi:hypothetical protein [Kaarinaea lacus]